MLEALFETYRPAPKYPVYPPYHTGRYLEDFFCDWYYSNDIKTDRVFIPVSWTTCYIDKKTEGLQDALDKLDPSKKYFTVSQYDDGICQTLPPDTLQFNAGGNSGGIPIPLVCSKLPVIAGPLDKDIFASFVGSMTHPVRHEMYGHFRGKTDCFLELKSWSPTVTDNNFYNFISAAMRSKFLLCPRGYGLNSFRLYEAFQLKCVPVVITDELFLPWQDELDWSKFCVVTGTSNNIYDLLKSISEQEYNEMLEFGQKIYEEYFTLEGTCKQITKRVS